jgi:hypothetical protein
MSAVNPQINALVTLIAEDPLKSADIADKAIADGAALGLLHGIPFSIKDSLDTAGVLTQRLQTVRGQHYGQGCNRGRTIQSGRRHSAHEDQSP